MFYLGYRCYEIMVNVSLTDVQKSNGSYVGSLSVLLAPRLMRRIYYRVIVVDL